MWSPRLGSLSQARPSVRRLLAWGALAVGGLLPTTGCQVEYAGMTLPSGKYMHDDVQYFAPGPDFPWANTQAATQRARMQAMGIDVAPPAANNGPLQAPVAAGAIAPVQNQMGRPTDINQSPLSVEPPVGGAAPAPPAPGNVTPPPPPAGGAVPPPPPPGDK